MFHLRALCPLIVEGRMYQTGELLRTARKVRYWKSYDGAANFARECYGHRTWLEYLKID